MLDSSFKFPKQEQKTFDPLPNGVYQCSLQEIELRDGTNFTTHEPEPQFSFTFIVIEEGEHYGRKLWANASLKLVGGTKSSNLYKVLSALADKQFTKEECLTSDEWMTSEFLNSFIGKQQLLAVSQKPKQTGGMKNVIDSILPVKAQLPAYIPKDL